MTTTRSFAGFALVLLLTATATAGGAAEDIVLKSTLPMYEVNLPSGYMHTTPREIPLRYVRFSGRESWATLSVIATVGDGPLAQNRAGITLEEVLPFVPLPPEAKRTFKTLRWQDFDIGVVEYRAVVKDLPVIGISVVLPLKGKALTLTAYAPEPLEKELREDFKTIVDRLKNTVPSWRTEEEFRKIETANKVGIAGAVLAGLYLPVWVLAFRGHLMRAHWVRTVWFVVIALLLFYPISSPGETTMLNNLVVNGVLPLAYMLFAARRIKLSVELD